MEDSKDRARVERIQDIVSDEGRETFEYVNFVSVSGFVGIFGIVANVININIFYKQGFSSTTNIAFFALAMSDLCCLVNMLWVGFGANPAVANSGIKWMTLEVTFLSGAWLHVCFCRITSFITIYVTAERYISISQPLKVKQIITPKRTTIILLIIYCVNVMALTPEYVSSYLEWTFFPERNQTLLALAFTSSRKDLEGLENVLHSGLGTVSFVGVVVCTAVLVAELRRSSDWRKQVTVNTGKLTPLSDRDQKTVKMVVLIACILIICYTPGAAISMITFIIGPEFNVLGKHYNLLMAAWSFAYSFQAINSSVNIFLYYNLSSKYRQTFKTLFMKYRIRLIFENQFRDH